ncbi:hypothetical protein [Paenibacillus sp. CF095]|nr:hypothetical protein [Paenibacillus sp. CF095]
MKKNGVLNTGYTDASGNETRLTYDRGWLSAKLGAKDRKPCTRMMPQAV